VAERQPVDAEIREIGVALTKVIRHRSAKAAADSSLLFFHLLALHPVREKPVIGLSGLLIGHGRQGPRGLLNICHDSIKNI